MPNFRGWEILIIVALILLLFGAKRLPDAARGLGRSLRIFKAETKAMQDEDTPDGSPSTPGAPQALDSATAPVDQQPQPATTPERTET